MSKTIEQRIEEQLSQGLRKYLIGQLRGVSPQAEVPQDMTEEVLRQAVVDAWVANHQAADAAAAKVAVDEGVKDYFLTKIAPTTKSDPSRQALLQAANATGHSEAFLRDRAMPKALEELNEQSATMIQATLRGHISRNKTRVDPAIIAKRAEVVRVRDAARQQRKDALPGAAEQLARDDIAAALAETAAEAARLRDVKAKASTGVGGDASGVAGAGGGDKTPKGAEVMGPKEAATVIQKAFRKWRKERKENKAAIFISKNLRRYIQKKHYQRILDEKKRQKRQDLLDTDPEVLEATIKMQTAIRARNAQRLLAAKKAEALVVKAGAGAVVVDRLTQEEAAIKIQAAVRGLIARRLLAAKKAEALVVKAGAGGGSGGKPLGEEQVYKGGDAAARKIQQWWRRRKREIKNGRKEFKVDEEVLNKRIEAKKALIDKITAGRKDGWPKIVDRSQMAREIDSQGLVYNETTKSFVKRDAAAKSYQGHFIEGIFGRYSGGVRGYRVGEDGQRYNRASGQPITDAQFILDGYERSRGHETDMCELGADGFMVADYSSLIELQKDVDAARLKQHLGSLPGAKRPFKYDGVRCSFARYTHLNYNDQQQFVGSEDRFVMLIQTKEGITEVFADEQVIRGKIAAAEAKFNDDATYKTMIAAALTACAGIADEDQRVIAAQKMVRQEIREKAMQQVVSDVQKAERQNVASNQFSKKDLDTINAARKLAYPFSGKRSRSFQEQVAQKFSNIPTPTSNYHEHGGVAISKNRRGADITFNGGVPHDVMWINYPGTSYYARVACAPESGPFMVCINGKKDFKYREKGETWIDENTVYYNDGTEYVPLRVHTNSIGVNPSNCLAHHHSARPQGGPSGYKGLRKVIDNFSIKVTAHVGEIRAVAIKVKAKGFNAGHSVSVSAVLGPVAYKDHKGERVVFQKVLVPIDQISNKTFKPIVSQDQYVQCPSADLHDTNLDKKFKFAKSTKNPEKQELALEKQRRKTAHDETKVADDKAKEATNRIDAAFGPVFVRVRLVEEADLLANADQYGDKKAWRKIENENGVFYRETKLYRRDNSGGYLEVGLDDVRAALIIKGDESQVDLSAEDVERYSQAFMHKNAFVEIRDLGVKDAARDCEQNLRYFAHAGKSAEALALIQDYTKRKAKIDEQFKDASTEEKEAAYRQMSFDINAVDPRSGQTALHMAAHHGRGDVVAALLKAGADPKIKDKKGKTAADLGEKGGKFDADDRTSALLDLKKDTKARYKVREKIAKMTEDERNAAAMGRKVHEAVVIMNKYSLDYIDATWISFDAAQQRVANPDDANLVKAEQEAKINLAGAKKVFEEEKIKFEELKKEAAKADKKAGKTPPKAKSRNLTPTPELCENGYKRIVVGDKYVEVGYHLAKEDGAVVSYLDSKGKPQNKVLKAGDVILDGVVRYIDPEAGGNVDRRISKDKHVFGLIGGVTTAPDRWSAAQWKEAYDGFEAVKAALKDSKDVSKADNRDANLNSIAVGLAKKSNDAKAAAKAKEGDRVVLDDEGFNEPDLPPNATHVIDAKALQDAKDRVKRPVLTV